MKAIKTIKLQILSHNDNTFAKTLSIYREALEFFIDVINQNWHLLYDLTERQKLKKVEKLTHATRSNPAPPFEFDNKESKFYKFPSYFRRSCIKEALGIVSSHKSRHENWLQKRDRYQSKGKEFNEKPPKLQYNHYSFPVFYKKNMFKKLDNNKAQIKVYRGNSNWEWVTITFDDNNLTNRGLDKYKELNPSLVKKYGKYHLHIPYEKKIEWEDLPKIQDQKVLAVDLGINKSAVCSVLKFDGTVIGRKFIDQPIEKDRLKTKVNRLAKAQRETLNQYNKPNYWRRINNLRKSINQQTVNGIIKFAKKHDVDIIVFEYLSNFSTPKGFIGAKALRKKLQYWDKMKIQNKTMEKAHRWLGIRIRRVNARNTSKLAFDGSGEVERGVNKQGKKTNYEVCVFPNGKEYNTDLNASYNIGARYYIKYFLKPLSEKIRLKLEAKVPAISKRTTCVLASLISLNESAKQLDIV